MALTNDTGFLSGRASSAGSIAIGDVVALRPGNKFAAASAGSVDAAAGTALNYAAAGAQVTVKALNAGGTHRVTATEAIGDTGDVYKAANGKVASSGSVLLGKAREASSGAGDEIEILPL